jgi:hypothetical protein
LIGEARHVDCCAPRPVATSRADAARRILAYFLRNPQAADDAEGVARFRLMNQTIFDELRETQDALDWLVAEGYLTSNASAGALPIFQLNRSAAARAQSFIDHLGDEEPGR